MSEHEEKLKSLSTQIREATIKSTDEYIGEAIVICKKHSLRWKNPNVLALVIDVFIRVETSIMNNLIAGMGSGDPDNGEQGGIEIEDD